MNNHKHYRKMMSDSLREIKESGDQQPLNKAPVEYSPHEGDETPTRPIQTPSQKWTQIHEQELPNGLVYKQYKQSHRDYESPEEDVEFQHHLVDPSTGKSVSILRTTAFLPRNPDYSMPHEHTITWAQTDPSQKGKGLGKQAYLATLIHGYGVGRLNSDTLLSQSGHKAWSSLKNVPGIKVNLAPYATDQDFEMSREFYDKAEKKYHTMRVHNKDELDHNKMFPSVDLSAKEEKLAASEKIVGGKGDRKKDSQFSPKEIKMGHKVEMEHTSSPRIAAEITRDHLTENPKYYSKLKQAGLADELKKGKIGPECKTKLKAYSRRKGWQYPSAVVHLQAGKICGSKTKSEDLENNLRKDLRRWVKEKWANPKGETHHGSGKTGWRPTVRVSGKTPQTWGEMTPHQKKKKVQNKKKANKRGGGWSTHESGKKQVWNTKKSDLLEKIEFLEKAEPPPTLIGQISPDGRKKAIGIPGGEIVWDVHPRLKREIDTRIIQKARDWLKTQPAEHHPILKQFINEIISDPYRHVRYGSNKKNGPIMPRLRHVEAMVTNHPEAKLVVHSPESMSLYVGRHGEWKGISHFKHELKKGLVKSENLFYNGLNGSYTDEFGNTYKFSDGNGHELSKSERDALGTEDGLLRQFRRLAKTDEATIRRISLFLRHGGVRGNAGSGRNEEGHGAPHGDGALLSMMNDAVFDDPWDQAKHDREHLDNDDNGNGGEIVFDDPWDQAKHDREHLDSDSLDLNKAEESDNPIFSRAAWRDENGQIGLPQLYRHYKNSPHHPVSLALKYLVHRIENEGKYNTASQESKNQMDSDFLQFHQAGGAKHKNGDVTTKHLNDFYDSHAQKLIPQLLDHKKRLHNSIIYNFPDAIKDIDGQPHIALTRGLNTEQPGKDHALSSYADAASTGFGTHMHHRWVPLNNLWFSYETGPKKATSEKFGNEKEYLVSPHEIKPAKKGDVKPIFGSSGQFHDFNFEPLKKLQGGTLDTNDELADLLESHAHRIHPKVLNAAMDRFGTHAADAISRNEHINHEITQRLLNFNHPLINLRLARSNLHPSFQEALSNHEDFEVRRELASNPNLHPSLHEKLANDKEHEVRGALAINGNLHPSAQEKLANDDVYHVRLRLAANRNLHPSLHEKLANDKDNDVSGVMKQNPNYIGNIKKSESVQSQLKKGARGNWKKEKYVLRYHAPKGKGAYGLHTVTAHDSNGNVVGELSAEDLNDGTFQANIVEVHPEHRRKGIAGAMYNHMETKTGLRAVPDLEAQTPEGAALWRQKNRPFGKSELEKGSLQSRNKFNPNKEPQSKLKQWANKGKGSWSHPRSESYLRDQIPEIGSTGKQRIKQKLFSETITKRHPETGELMFLLHRGASPKEIASVNDGEKYNHQNTTSWTPDIRIAAQFGQQGLEETMRHIKNGNPELANVMSAWVKESAIHNAPKMFSSIAGENEIIIKPEHNSIKPSKMELQNFYNSPNWKEQAAMSNLPSKQKIRDIEANKTLNLMAHFNKSEEIFTSLQKASASKKLLGMLGLVAATSMPITQPKQTFSPKNDYSTNQTIQKDVDLRSIADTESGNKDKASHETVMTGLNAGSSAIGRYGMMPITTKELVVKNPSLNKYKHVLKYSDSQLADFMHKNPQFQKEVASAHYDRLFKIFNGNLIHIAHAWLNGVQGTKNAIKAKQNLNSHWHVQKVINARNKILGIKTEDKKQKVNKKPKKVQMPKSSKIIIP